MTLRVFSLSRKLSLPKYDPLMFKVTVDMRYPWAPVISENEQVSFILSGESPASSPADAEQVVRRLIDSGLPGWVLDADGTGRPFYAETVRDVSTMTI